MKRVFIDWFLSYLRFFAKIQMAKIRPIIIGVAGSSGKSSLVSLLQEVLSAKYTVKTSGGKNSETGIPLSILGITMQSYSFWDWLRVVALCPIQVLVDWKKYDVYVAEMGIDSPVPPKNMGYLLKIISPTIGMVTNVSYEHSVYFDPYVIAANDKERREAVIAMTAREETMLLKSLKKDDTAIINLDDTYIAKANNDISAKKITISTKDKSADLFVDKIEVTLNRFVMQCIWHNKTYRLTIPQLLPAFYAYEFLFVIATSLSLDIPLSETISRLESQFSLPPGRLSLFDGIKHTTVIDSSYNNATPEPILGILDLLKHMPTPRQRKVAIIGDMRELGSQSKREHEEVAEALVASVDSIILIGPLMHNYAVPIIKKSHVPYMSFLRFTDAKEAIVQEIKEKDIILVKSSQNTLFLERVVEMLLADKKDVNKLCRRGEFWDKKRAESL